MKACVVLDDDVVVSRAEILAGCQRKLAPSGVPKYIEFLAALPKGATGKIDKTGLA